MFHENLRQARENLEITQKEMAELVGIPVTTYRNYENTLREPGYDILIKISEVLGISTDELLGIKSSEDKYKPLFDKIRRLSEKKLQTLSALADFLYTTK